MQLSKEESLRYSRLKLSPRLFTLARVFFFVGLVGFLTALFLEKERAVQVFLVGFVYFFGLSLGCVMWSVIQRITSALWGRAMIHLWEGAGLFLLWVPILYLLLIALSFYGNLYPWLHHTIPHKEFWLSPGFVFLRGALEVFGLCALGLYYLYHSFRLDAVFLGNDAPPLLKRFFSRAIGNSGAHQGSLKVMNRLSPLFALLYAILMSFFAFDFVMSLEPYWYSTLFGGFIFSQNLLMALAFMAVLFGWIRKQGGLGFFLDGNPIWDVGKLLFAFTMFWTYLMWAQYLPIWYGNMPEEAGYVLKRTSGPYYHWAFLLLAMVWVIPWLILLFKRSKMRPVTMGIAGGLVLLGIWNVIWTLVIPSQFPIAPVPRELAVFPGWVELSGLLLFSGLFLSTYFGFLASFPVLPVGDPLFHEAVRRKGGH
jgi:hypothetical protein